MTRLFVAPLLLACLTLTGSLRATPATADTLAILNVAVIDTTGAAPQSDMTVIVRDGRIAARQRRDGFLHGRGVADAHHLDPAGRGRARVRAHASRSAAHWQR